MASAGLRADALASTPADHQQHFASVAYRRDKKKQEKKQKINVKKTRQQPRRISEATVKAIAEMVRMRTLAPETGKTQADRQTNNILHVRDALDGEIRWCRGTGLRWTFWYGT